MTLHLTEKDVTPAVKQSVSAYLLARVYAETMRDKIDEIQRQILSEIPLINPKDGQRITEPKYSWTCTDDELMLEYYAECNIREREAGLKPSDMEDDFCPALVAENILSDTRKLIFDAAAEMLDMDIDGKELHHRLLCRGLDEMKKFIDLVVGLVVNLPDFKKPLAL